MGWRKKKKNHANGSETNKPNQIVTFFFKSKWEIDYMGPFDGHDRETGYDTLIISC